jgi:hypothetical protein
MRYLLFIPLILATIASAHDGPPCGPKGHYGYAKHHKAHHCKAERPKPYAHHKGALHKKRHKKARIAGRHAPARVAIIGGSVERGGHRYRLAPTSFAVAPGWARKVCFGGHCFWVANHKGRLYVNIRPNPRYAHQGSYRVDRFGFHRNRHTRSVPLRAAHGAGSTTSFSITAPRFALPFASGRASGALLPQNLSRLTTISQKLRIVRKKER